MKHLSAGIAVAAMWGAVAAIAIGAPDVAALSSPVAGFVTICIFVAMHRPVPASRPTHAGCWPCPHCGHRTAELRWAGCRLDLHCDRCSRVHPNVDPALAQTQTHNDPTDKTP